jgi:uncharacterized membrane protein
MHIVHAIVFASQPTFGREIAQFKELVGFLAIVSVVLWAIVIITMVLRMWLCHIWYRRRYRTHHEVPPT